MGYNSPRYVPHGLPGPMSQAFADRDFYYGDPSFPPEEAGGGPPLEGVREAALRPRSAPTGTTPTCGRGPYPFQGGQNPFKSHLDAWRTVPGTRTGAPAHDRTGAG